MNDQGSSVWSSLAEPGKMILVNGAAPQLRSFLQELTYWSVHDRPGYVLWCDGEHGMNPYDFADLNLERGHPAEFGADRVLVKRCMTPFQWDTVLTRHVAQKLIEVDASLVLAAPYNALFSTDELKDWEQEDYVRFSLQHLKGLAQKHKVPIVLSVDMARWWRTHPVLAQMTHDAAQTRWTVARVGSGWRAVRDTGNPQLETETMRQFTLWEYARPLDAGPSTPPEPSGVPKVVFERR